MDNAYLMYGVSSNIPLCIYAHLKLPLQERIYLRQHNVTMYSAEGGGGGGGGGTIEANINSWDISNEG